MGNIISAYNNTGNPLDPPVFGGLLVIPGQYVASEIRSPNTSAKYPRQLKQLFRRGRYWAPHFVPRARITQEGLEVVTSGTPQARTTQEGIEVLTVGTPQARTTQDGLEVLTTGTPQALTTQLGIEVVTRTANPAARTTQEGLEVLVGLPNPVVIFPPVASAKAKTIDPTVQIKGDAHVYPVGPASAKALTVPGPLWSVTVFGALAQTAVLGPPVPDPSFDIRPGRKTTGIQVTQPWLGAPFNASDDWANATVIQPSSLPYTVRGSTEGFTTETGEPQPIAGVITNTGWFTFTPTISGFYQISLLNSTPSYNTMLAVYRQGSSGISGLVEIASNDNIGPGDNKSNVYPYLTAGTQYWIQVGTAGFPGVGAIFQLDIRLISETCQPVQLGGSITANFWLGWGCSTGPTVVGGFGGCPVVASAPCPSSWASITVIYTMDNSNSPNDAWFMAYEIWDEHNQLLGGRGDFFTGPSNGRNSWQVKVGIVPGQSVTQTVNFSASGIAGGGDTTHAKTIVMIAFPQTSAAKTGSMHMQAAFNGVCPLPFVAGKARSWAWWT